MVGVLADAYIGDVYDSDYVTTLVGEQMDMLSNFKQSLNGLLSSGFLSDQDDQEFAREMVACADLLLAEATALNSYLGYGTDEEANAFQTARTNAWDKLALLLGLD